ncbi:MAG: thioredoxin family protein [Deltaproteobacteria bacterium]|nr:thioredoxin family protein [Deltaproteobacteria bacterium]
MGQDDSCQWVDNAHDLAGMLKTGGAVVALFYASWCSFCVKFLPAFQQHAQGNRGRFVIVQDDDEAMAAQYSVDVYPTVLFIEGGTVLKRLDGVLGVGLDEKKLAGFIASCPLS